MKTLNLMSPLCTPQALHTEIKGKKEKVEDVQKNADTCAASIKVGSQLICALFQFEILLYIFQNWHKQVWYKIMKSILGCVFSGLWAAAGFLQFRPGNSA